MKLVDAMKDLQRAGTAQNVKVYRRHGAKDPLFGVSFANLRRLRRQIGTDPTLAQDLWDTGNTDARTLACMIADPAKVSRGDLDRWVRDIDYHTVGDVFVKEVVAKTPHVEAKARAWTRRRADFVKRAGFHLLRLLAEDPDGPPDAFFRPYLDQIASEIHSSPNRARESMNTTLIAIGKRSPGLRKAARRVARRVGPVTIDHGETSCGTPNAVDELA